MCSPALALTGAGAAASALGAYGQAQGQQANLNYQAGISDNNAVVAEWQARDAVTRGQQEVFKARLSAGKTIGAQTAAFAARGIDIGEGSAAGVLADSRYISDLEATQIEDNAAREAWGYRTQATQYTDAGRAQRATADSISPWKSAATSLLGSAGTVATSWYRLNPSAVSGADARFNGTQGIGER